MKAIDYYVFSSYLSVLEWYLSGVKYSSSLQRASRPFHMGDYYPMYKRFVLTRASESAGIRSYQGIEEPPSLRRTVTDVPRSKGVDCLPRMVPRG